MGWDGCSGKGVVGGVGWSSIVTIFTSFSSNVVIVA